MQQSHVEVPAESIQVEITISEAIPVCLRTVTEQFNKAVIEAALSLCDGVKARAARMLLMNRTTLVERMRYYGLPLKESYRKK